MPSTASAATCRSVSSPCAQELLDLPLPPDGERRQAIGLDLVGQRLVRLQPQPGLPERLVMVIESIRPGPEEDRASECGHKLQEDCQIVPFACFHFIQPTGEQPRPATRRVFAKVGFRTLV
jgi:hypothetical protein